MMRLVFMLCASLSVAGLASAQGFNPHEMMQADGSADTSKCSLCHDPSFALARSKAETCTLCHSESTHSGSAEHLRAGPAAVAGLIPAKEGKPSWPLTEDGHIYCGTCHLFHDPALKMGPDLALDVAWVRPTTGLPYALRLAKTEEADQLVAKVDGVEKWGEFSATGSRMLRGPVGNGSLCRHCHGDYVGAE
jgi:hypothetical protein